jgi:pimeloyl-ACP methyl ester carboxylesterase
MDTQATGIGRLVGDDYGRSDLRPPLVLLHGMTFDRTMWRDVVPELMRVDPGRRVIVLDLPGHGQSPDQATYELDDTVGQVHRVVEEAGLTAPVVVGHSAAGHLATIYAARYPTRGVVNIDSPLDVRPFAALVRSLAERLRGPGFPTVWQMFYDSFHVELLPPAAQELVRSTCRPRQEVVVGFWRMLLEQPVDDVVAMIEQVTAAVRASGVTYLYLAGDEPGPQYRQWMGTHLPGATIDVWPGTGHFPHLADPARFARCLAATALWPTR